MVCRKRKVGTSLAPTVPEPFVIATDLDSIKPDPKSRKFIRHYVTKGKKHAKAPPRKRSLSSWLDGNSRISRDHSRFLSAQLAVGVLEPRVLQILHDFVPELVKVMFPIEQCVDLETERYQWHGDLAHDPSYARNSRLSHMSKSLGVLREQLADPTLVVSDSLIFTVVALALTSEASDELDDALTHLHGLNAMVNMRGGIGALASKRSLQIKCCRVDLAVSLRTANSPLLFTSDSLTWKPYLADPAKSPAAPWRAHVGDPDIRLVDVWRDLREFTMSVNLALQTKRKISPVLFQEVLISVQYRLNHLAFSSSDLQETLRLTMLALSASLFLDVRCRPSRYQRLASTLNVSLQGYQNRRGKACLELELWLLFIAKMAVLGTCEDQPWLEGHMRATIRALSLSCWAEIRQVLKCFLWVDILHDNRGEAIYGDLASPGQEEVSTAAS